MAKNVYFTIGTFNLDIETETISKARKQLEKIDKVKLKGEIENYINRKLSKLAGVRASVSRLNIQSQLEKE